MEFESVQPGSTAERKAVSKLKSELEEVADQLDIAEVPVYTWKHECNIVVNGTSEQCVHLPYSAVFNGTVKPEDIVVLDGYEALETRELKGKVVVADYPKSYSELRLLVYELARRGAELAVLTPGEYLKVDTVLGSPGLSDHPSVPLPLCVVVTPLRTLKLAVERGFELQARSQPGSDRGLVLLARVNGGGEYEIHLVTHHDTMIGGFEVSTSTVMKRALERLRKRDLRVNLVAISYTARELGDYLFTEYHFNWSERYLLSLLESKGLLDRTAYAIAIGPLHGDSKPLAHVHPVFNGIEELLGFLDRVDYDHLYTEGHQYMKFGIPSITITTLPKTWYLHNTSLRVTYSGEQIDRILDALALLIEKFRPSNEWIVRVRRAIYKHVGETRLEARVAVSRLLDTLSLHDLYTGIREVTRYGYGVLEVACTNPLTAEALSGIGAVIMESSLNKLRSVLESCRGEVLISTSDYTMRILGRGVIEPFLSNYVEYWLKRFDTHIELLTLKALVRRGRSSNGVEEHRYRQVQGLR